MLGTPSAKMSKILLFMFQFFFVLLPILVYFLKEHHLLYLVLLFTPNILYDIFRTTRFKEHFSTLDTSFV